jgi:hypothetical protein
MQEIAPRMPKGPDFGAPARLAISSGNPPFVSGIAAHAWEGKTVGVGGAGAQTRQALPTSRPWWRLRARPWMTSSN